MAQALRAHFGFSERLLSNRATEPSGSSGSRGHAGLVVGNAITDAKGKAPGSSAPPCLPMRTAYCGSTGTSSTRLGTLYADVIAVSAVDADGNDLQAIVPTDRDGVELFDDWDGFGQRTTASRGARDSPMSPSSPVEVTTVSERQVPRAQHRLPTAVSGRGHCGHRRRSADRRGRIRAAPGPTGGAFAGRYVPRTIRSSCVRSARSRRRRRPPQTLVLSAADTLDAPGRQRFPERCRRAAGAALPSSRKRN